MIEAHWTAYVTASTMPTLALVGAAIAYRQWRTAQNKLKLDLFDKRMQVYQAVRDTLGYIVTHGKFGNEQQIAYLSGIQTAKWLFDPEVDIYLRETLWRKLSELLLYHDEPDQSERRKYIQSRAKTIEWLTEQYSVLDKKCAKYMHLGH